MVAKNGESLGPESDMHALTEIAKGITFGPKAA